MSSIPEGWKRIPQDHPALARIQALIEGNGQLHLPTLTHCRLEELASLGLHEVDRQSGSPPKEPGYYHPRAESLYEDVHPLRLEGSREVLWLKVNGRRSERGFKNLEVLAMPLRSDVAIVAALTALEANKVNPEELDDSLVEHTLQLFEGGPRLFTGSVSDVGEELGEEELVSALAELVGDEARRKRIADEIRYVSALEFVIALLHHYRPEFHSLPREEQITLVRQGCKRVNEYLDALRKLIGFLEHWVPDRDLKSRAKEATEAIEAAVLQDVEGLSNLRLGQLLNIEPPPSDRYKRTNKTAGDRAKRGRRLLVNNLGEDAWRELVEAKKAERDRFLALDEEEQGLVRFAEDEGLPVEYARQLIEDARKE